MDFVFTEALQALYVGTVPHKEQTKKLLRRGDGNRELLIGIYPGITPKMSMSH